MLPRQLLLAGLFLFIAFIGSAQHHHIDVRQPSTVTSISSETIEQTPFLKGINEFTVMQNLSLLRTKPENSDSHNTDISINLDDNYFLTNHVAIGGEFDLSSSKTKTPNTSSTSTNWMFYGDVMYGTTISDFNVYAKASVGFGDDKFSGNATSSKQDEFGYKVEVGFPIHLFQGGGNYITPYLGYNHLQEKSSGIKYTENEFNVGLKFQNYSTCSSHQCDCHHGRVFSHNAYDAGRSFIGYTSWGNFGFGNWKYESGNTVYKDDVSGGNFDFEYGYYFVPDIAIGASVSWDDQTTKSNGTKFTSSGFQFMPMITGNLPVDNCWNNLFLQVGYGFGSEKTSTGSNDMKTNLTTYGAYLGFNDYFGEHIAVTPKIGYEEDTYKNTTTDIKTKSSGIELGIGLSLRF